MKKKNLVWQEFNSRFETFTSLFFLGALLLVPPALADTKGINLTNVKKDLAQGNYKDLMYYHDFHLAQLKQDGNSGHLSRYYDLLAKWENMAGLTQWTRAEPNNPVPWTAVGIACFNKGSNIRGDDTIDKVSSADIKNYEHYFSLAKPYLDEAVRLNPSDPYPYAYLMEIGLHNSWPQKAIEDNFQKAIQIVPGCQMAVWDMALYHSPLWEGTAEDMAKFVDQYARTTPPGNYLRLLIVRYHEDVWHAQGSHNSFWGNTPEWAESKQEFETYLAVHPKDLRVRSWYSFFAYFGHHYREAKEQFDVLGDKWNTNSAHWLIADGYFKAKDYANRHANDLNQGSFSQE